MGPIQWFLTVYVLGGVTFLPLVLVLAYLTLPRSSLDSSQKLADTARLSRTNDDDGILKTGTDDLAEKFQRKHESDVAAGYFAVCREYVPGGVNGKPPDKLSPAGEVVATESPSVYQSMYRSLFDRSQKPTIEPTKEGPNKNVKSTRNVFYVVLRHGHLMLYDDIQQLEVRYVISLEYHDIDLYGGGQILPEGELWIKRHAIMLKRKNNYTGAKSTSLPFFLFSENLSEKEDFYFALLNNQAKRVEDMPIPQDFEVDHIVALVQKLHSSGDNLQTRWINALIGRLFLATYKTPEFEQFIRQKLSKKISRVKKPTFITKVSLQKIDTGVGAPFVTNPRLKDLTVNGDCTVEADLEYTGKFRIEIAATARIDLGTRFKAREVDMVLAATCKKLQGHVLLRFKPAPSNRVWFTFEKVPQLDLALEPIVSSRQITYTVILKAIESRIREVIAESVCLPFWDDIPFTDTSNERYRGGIWKRELPRDINTEIKDEDPEDEAEFGSSATRTLIDMTKKKDDRSMSTPVLVDEKDSRTPSPDKKTSSTSDLVSQTGEAKSPPQAPRVMRSTSFATVADPMISAEHAAIDGGGEAFDSPIKHDDAANSLRDLSAKSSSLSMSGSQAGSASGSTSTTPMHERSSSIVSKESQDAENKEDDVEISMESSASTISGPAPHSTTSRKHTPSSSKSSMDQNEPKLGKAFAQAAKSISGPDRKQALASINAATTAAQKWGWGVLARNKQKEGQPSESSVDNTNETPSTPMGRGHPLPPPGMPLPHPQRSNTKSTLFSMPKRKPVPPPLLPKRPDINEMNTSASARSSPRPPLPERRRRQSSLQNDQPEDDEVLVVAAPTESGPASPISERQNEFIDHHEGPEMPTSDTPSPKLSLPSRDDHQKRETISRIQSPDAVEHHALEQELKAQEMSSLGLESIT